LNNGQFCELPHQKSTPNYFNYNLISSIFKENDRGKMTENRPLSFSSTKLGGSPAFCRKVFSYWFIVVSLNNRRDACPTLEEEIASPAFAGAGLLRSSQ